MMMRVRKLLKSCGLCARIKSPTRPGFDRGRFSVVDSIAPIGTRRVGNATVTPGGGIPLPFFADRPCCTCNKPVTAEGCYVGGIIAFCPKCMEFVREVILNWGITMYPEAAHR